MIVEMPRDSESATVAGLKYFLLGGLSSCFILLGAALIYSYTGLTTLESIFNLVSSMDSAYTCFRYIVYSIRIFILK